MEAPQSLRHQLDSAPYVERWQYYAYKAGLLKTEEEVQGVIIKGIDEKFDSAYFSKNLISGRFPNISGEGYSTEVALSKKIANYLKLEDGDEVLIYFVQNPPRFRKLQITGIYETGLEEFDERIVLGDLDLIRRINGWEGEEVGGIEVFVDQESNIEAAENFLFDRLDFDLFVEKVSDRYLQIFDWLSLLNRNVLILLILILFVACFSMVSILLILIMERTRMIGMLKAMGATNRQIREVFFSTGWRLILKGLGWGNFIGLGLAALQYHFHLVPLDPVTYYMSYVPLAFDW
jgi:lipoprotein-releasing system permease protein